MKTIREWLSELPEPYKGQALANATDAGTIDETDYYSLSDALTSAFDWTKGPTEHGYDYWETIAKSEGNILPYAGQTEPPNNALSALHAIAGKEGFSVEEIMSVEHKYGDVWAYWLKDVPHEMIVNLSNDK